MASEKIQLGHEFLDIYLRYVEETESPRIFHIWCALSGIGACLGRRVSLPFGADPLYANMFAVLTGPPGARKSTAINYAKKRLEAATKIRFAPDDTAGKKQGLIAAIKGLDNKQTLNGALDAAGVVAQLENAIDDQINIDVRDRYTMFAVQGEFTTFIGNNQNEFLTFLTKLFDGEPYTYTLKNEETTLGNSLLSILGATTPTNLEDALPKAAIGQGFMSRIVLVHATKKYKRKPKPEPPPEVETKLVEKIYNELFYRFEGQFRIEPKADEMLEAIYGEDVDFADPRFIYYLERRYTHLLKLCMVLAASRKDLTITVKDVKVARQILGATEKTMPDALGEFGLSPVAAAKQKVVEFLQHANAPVLESIIWAFTQRDMRRLDFMNMLHDLTNAGKVHRVDTNEGPAYLYNSNDTETVSLMVDELLAEEDK